jgi:hypothetical protein
MLSNLLFNRHRFLFELEDQPWFPGPVRQGMQDWMEFMGNLDRSSYAGFAARLKEHLARAGETRLVDLCSGGAGPTQSLVQALKGLGYPVTVTLTDLYPNEDAFAHIAGKSGGSITFIREPVDAQNVPADLRGFRVLANSFHHFPPDAARGLLADAVNRRSGIAVVEAVGPSFAALVAILLGILLCTLATPFLKPFKLSRLLLTFAIPAIPVCAVFDGVMSCLRVYSIPELRRLAHGVSGGESYHWEIGKVRVPRTPLRLRYLIGSPK